MFNSLKAKLFWAIGTFAVLGAAGFLIFGRGQEAPRQSVEVRRADLVQEVSVSGKVEPAESIDLAFEKSGKVSQVTVSVGDSVRAGQLLVSLNNSELAAQLRQAQANLERERIKLQELERGTRAEELAVKQAELDKAKSDLASDYDDAITTLLTAYNDSDEAVRVNLYDIFTVTGPSTYDLSYLCDSSIEYAAASKREDSEVRLKQWNGELANLNAATSDELLEQAVTNAKSYIQVFRGLTDAVSVTLTTGSSCSLNASLQETYRTNNNSAQTNLVTAESGLNAWQQTIAAGKLTVARITNELNLKLAGSTEEQLAVQRATIRQMEATVSQYQAQIAKGQIVSPISGMVTKQDAKVGKIVSANETLISVISDKQYQIKAFVPEADIAKLKPDNPAVVTLDAYGSDIKFSAKVVKISPGETVVEGVSSYEVTFDFEQSDERVKSGLTANLEIKTAELKGVLVLPQRAVFSKDGLRFVEIPAGEQTVEVEVKIGLRGSDGNVEVLDGLALGQKVLIPE